MSKFLLQKNGDRLVAKKCTMKPEYSLLGQHDDLPSNDVPFSTTLGNNTFVDSCMEIPCNVCYT